MANPTMKPSNPQTHHALLVLRIITLKNALHAPTNNPPNNVPHIKTPPINESLMTGSKKVRFSKLNVFFAE